MVRVEVKAAATDAALIREVAETLCRGSRRAKELRSLLRLTMRPQKSLLDLLAIDLPDEVVDRALARPVDRPRDVDL